MMKESPPLTNADCVQIETATADDARQFRSHEYEVWKDTYINDKTGITQADIDWFFYQYRKLLSPESVKKLATELENVGDNEKVIIIKDGEIIIATAWLLKDEHMNELGSIYIKSDKQHLGIGQKIWNEANDFFNRMNPIFVTVYEKNENAITFYKKLGFREVEKIPSEIHFPSGAEFPQIRMVKQPRTLTTASA